MQTFDQALFDHLKAGRIEMEDAVSASTHPHDFKLLVAADGRRGTTMDDVQQAEDERTVGAPVGSALR
jgi:twitching motility protein PilT